MVGVPFMQKTLGAGARLAVEVAWGADLTASPGTWTWTEITGDVQQEGGKQIVMTHARGDEASTSQPASCTMQLDNTTGAYSQGGQSANWPNVRRNTPVRVRVDPNGGGDPFLFVTLFQGGATTWAPAWDITGRKATVQLTANGTLRRLGQGTSPIVSALRRRLLQRTDLIAYWPCEDGANSTQFAPGLPSGTPMVITGPAESPRPKFASDTSFDCSGALPEVNRTSWRGKIPTYPTTNEVQVRWLMKAPALMHGTSTNILTIYTSGQMARWCIYYVNSGNGCLQVQVIDNTGIAYVDTVTSFPSGIDFGINNSTRMWTFFIRQSGANLDWEIQSMALGYPSGGIYGSGQFGQIAARTFGAATAVSFSPINNAADGLTDTIIGQISVTDAVTGFFADQSQFNANVGETADTRISRLCTENDVPITIVGTSAITMGPQNSGTLLSLLRECETADKGILFDGLDAGLYYICGSQRINAGPGLTINTAAGELVKEFSPVDDDQRNVNKATATRKNGGDATVEDVTGPLGSGVIGTYDVSVTANIDSDGDIADHAGWAVNTGTVDGYRYPKLQIDLAHKPALATAWLAAKPSTRIDVTNPNTIRKLPAGTISLLTEGYTQSIDQFRWDVAVNCSSYVPWRVGVYAATASDAGEYVLRGASDGSTLASSASAGAGTLSVATPSGPLWTTVADDFPLSISVGGIKITVTAISGASSPQTFTVTGATVTKALTSGLAVELWQPTVLGM